MQTRKPVFSRSVGELDELSNYAASFGLIKHYADELCDFIRERTESLEEAERIIDCAKQRLHNEAWI